jgi:hypothetical protein
MKSWKVVSAKSTILKIQLQFSDALWVSQNTIPCFVELEFGDGEGFKSAGFSKAMKKGSRKRI